MSDKYLQAALSYANKGFHVFPVSRKKIPLIKAWPTRATTNDEEIKTFWTEYPNANIGIATGPKSGIWVLDIDSKNGVDGFKEIEELYPHFDARDNDLISGTPSGGIHFFFKWDNNSPVKTVSGILPGVDIRGEGGMVVVPPSCFNVNGVNRTYKWNNADNTPQLAPDWAENLANKSNKISEGNQHQQQVITIKKALSGVDTGARDDSLFRFACHLRKTKIDYDLALSFIKEAGFRCNPPIDAAISTAKVSYAYQKYSDNPVEEVLALEYNDFSHGEKYANLFRDELKWVAEDRVWYKWNGYRWLEDEKDHHILVSKKVREVIINEHHLIYALMADIANKENKDINSMKDKKELKDNATFNRLSDKLKDNIWSQKEVMRNAGIKSMISIAKSQDMTISTNTLDSKGKYIGVNNGVLNLVDLSLSQHDPKYLVSKHCNIDYDPEAKCPNWEDFMLKICEGNVEKVEYIQRIFGQGLLGPGFQKDFFIIFQGNGANGKSTMIDTIEYIMNDYANTTVANAITGNEKNKEYYVADIKSCRLLLINESPKGSTLDETLVKSLTDSGKMQGRNPSGRPFKFKPCATPILTTNYAPRISSDYAINRRLIYIEFNYTIPAEDKDPDFRKNKLHPESSGIFNWVVEGCLNYQANSLKVMPQCVMDERDQFIYDNDRMKNFLDSQCELVAGHKTLISEIKMRYIDWAQEKGYLDVTEDRVRGDLRSRGFTVAKIGGKVKVVGVKLKSKADLIKEEELEKQLEEEERKREILMKKDFKDTPDDTDDLIYSKTG